jgi:hypothetical protein
MKTRIPFTKQLIRKRSQRAPTQVTADTHFGPAARKYAKKQRRLKYGSMSRRRGVTRSYRSDSVPQAKGAW